MKSATMSSKGRVNLTPDIAYAMALDHVYGWATKPRQWASPDEREEEFWSHLRSLLGNPSDEALRAMLWEHREAIGRMNHRAVAHSLHGIAVTECAIATEPSEEEQRRLTSEKVMREIENRQKL